MGIFDIDSGADNHLLNEQFHVFSKSPASVATALGDASNRSGHTVTASDVWGQEIPAFFYAKTQAVADTYKSLAKTNDLCRIGNSVAIFENGDWVVKYNSYTDIPDGHKFKNANGDEVIRFHKNRLAYNLNLDNNAADDGLNTTAKIQGWDEENGKVYDYVATAPKFVSQFVTSTDKIVDGIPSKGFGPFVMAGTTTGDITKVLPEGTSDSNHYIANSFAGIIQFNKARTDAIYVHAFEYCGKTLKSAYSDIVELDEKLSKISVTAAGGVQALSDAAKSAGLEIDAVVTDGVTTPTLNIQTGSVTAGETKLVSGGAVAAVTDALSGRIAQLEGIAHFSVAVVDTLPTTLVENTIYLVPEDGSTTGTYVEYIAYKPEGSETVTTERIGTTAIDLEGYTTDAEHEALAGETGRVTVVEGKVKTLEETTVPALEQAISDAKDEAIANATVKLTQGTGITITNSGTAQHEFTISVSDTVATSADLQALTNRVSANEGDIKTITEETIVGLDTRLSDAEATITTLTGEGNDSIAKKIESAINSAKEEIKGTTDAIAATANTAVQTASGDTYVSAEKEAGTTNIKVTTNISAIDAELVKTSSSVGAAIKAASDAAAKAASDADSALTAAKNEIKATTDGLAEAITKAQSDAVTAANSYTDGQISAAKEEIKGTTDAIAATANTAAQSAEGDTYVSASQSGTKITVSTNIANITSHVDSELVKSGTAVANAIQAASNAGTGAAAEALAAAQAAQQTAEARISSVTEGTDSSLLTVSTEGTAVTITLDSDVATKTNISETALTGEGESSDKHVKVTLGGTLGNQSVTVTTDDIASAAALQSLSERVTALHQTPQFSVVVVAGVTDLTNWEAAVDGGIKKNTIYLVENIEAADGSYIEFIAYESGETVVTERIGTTKTDLADYAKTTEVEQAISDAIGALDATNVGTGAVKVSQVDGVVTSVTVATEALVTDGAINASVTDANALVTAADALEAIKLAKPENYVASVTGYTPQGAEVTTTQGAAIKFMDDRMDTVTANDLWGTSVLTNGETISIRHRKLSNPSRDGAWLSDVKAVQNNKAYSEITTSADGKFTGVDYNSRIAHIQTWMIEDGSYMFYNTSLASFSGDLSSLTNGWAMFSYCKNLTTFDVDLSSLTYGGEMFYNSSLESFNGDLSSLVDGSCMFSNSSLASFSVDLSSLVIGSDMFDGTYLETFNGDLSSLVSCTGMFNGCTSLTSFSGDLSSLTNGRRMFNGCTSLTSFIGDLSSLISGDNMFLYTKLDTESVECIADTIRNVEDLSENNGVTKRIDIGIANETPNEAENAAFK